eukprot:3683945-Rhodomonas_salina.1
MEEEEEEEEERRPEEEEEGPRRVQIAAPREVVQEVRTNPPMSVFSTEVSNPPPGVYLNITGAQADPIGISICT